MMIGSLDPAELQVTVIGAGVAGMLAARRLDELGYEVTLIEGSGRGGGLIETRSTPYGMAEAAAHSFLASAPVQAHFQSLGVELVGVEPDSKSRFIYRGGRMRKFPLTIREATKAFFRAYLMLADKAQDPSEMTIEDWAQRHLGQPALDYLISPMLTGVYAALPSEITVGAAFPKFAVPTGHSLFSYLLARNVTRRSLYAPKPTAPAPRPDGGAPSPKVRARMMAPRTGMGSWVRALEADLEKRLESRFVKGREVSSLPSTGNVVLCVPARSASRLLEGAGEKASAEALAAIEYAPMLSVTAFVEKSAFTREPRGVGVLIPRREERDALGILFNSSAFPGRVADPSRYASFTMMLGGSGRPDLVALGDDEVRRRVDQELKAVLGARVAATHLEISRWERAIPKYGRSLMKSWSGLRAGWCSRPGRVVFGNYTGQVSLRGMIETVSALELRPNGRV